MSVELTASSEDISRNDVFSREQYEALHGGTGTLLRADRRVLELTGADRLTYLQGLLTNDVAALAPGTGCYATFLTAQGRMIADVRVLETGGRVLLDLHHSTATVVRDKLDQFIFSEDVQVADLSASLSIVGAYGPTAATLVRAALDSSIPGVEGIPGPGELSAWRVFENRRGQAGDDSIVVARSDEIGVPGFDVFVPVSASNALTASLIAAGATAIDTATVDIARVEAGRPRWPEDMNEDTIPLEAGIEDRAISQTKGCYVGQEIIIRVLHRGHGRVARRLVGLGLDLDGGAPVPSSGDRIRSAERDIGAVTSAVFSPALRRPLALGYVHRDFVAPNTSVAIQHGEQSLAATVIRLPVSPRVTPDGHT
jgi:folate-binding protein YgfZ